MKLVHLSDLHVSQAGDPNWRSMRRCVYWVKKRHPDAVVCVTGDLVNNGRAAEFQVVRELLAPLNGAIVVPGNHDVKQWGILGSNPRPFAAAFSRGPGVYWYDDIQIIALDSNQGQALARGGVGYAQRIMLGHALEVPAARRVVMLHHHPFDRGLGLELVDADEFLAVLAGRCDLLLFGHKHVSAIWRGVYGVNWICAAGATPRDRRYRVFTVDESGVRYEEHGYD